MPETPRRPRLTDAETERRMLTAALERVRASGLAVGFGKLSFEELIVEANVSRSTVYRRWPSREEFYRRLLLELLAHGTGFVHYFSAEHLAEVMAAVTPRPDTTAEERRAHFVELGRIGAARNFEAVLGSPENQTHTALTAVVGCADGALRDDAVHALRTSETAFLARMATFYETTLGVVGYRVRPGVTHEQLAALGSALVQGYVNHAVGLPDHLLAAHRGDPFGTGVERDWTTVAIGYVGLMLSLTEPDPEGRPDPLR